MGAANVIPGVSGGTIALITNIYEDFINALKSCNGRAIKLLLTGQFKEFSNHINIPFLAAILLGLSSVFLALLNFLSFYLRNILLKSGHFLWIGIGISILHWKNCKQLELEKYSYFTIGTTIALGISFLNPTPIENTNYLFIFVCGVIGICGMILPGLSGSYILMLMGNYQLLMVTISIIFLTF